MSDNTLSDTAVRIAERLVDHVRISGLSARDRARALQLAALDLTIVARRSEVDMVADEIIHLARLRVLSCADETPANALATIACHFDAVAGPVVDRSADGSPGGDTAGDAGSAGSVADSGGNSVPGGAAQETQLTLWRLDIDTALAISDPGRRLDTLRWMRGRLATDTRVPAELIAIIDAGIDTANGSTNQPAGLHYGAFDAGLHKRLQGVMGDDTTGRGDPAATTTSLETRP